MVTSKTFRSNCNMSWTESAKADFLTVGEALRNTISSGEDGTEWLEGSSEVALSKAIPKTTSYTQW